MTCRRLVRYVSSSLIGGGRLFNTLLSVMLSTAVLRCEMPGLSLSCCSCCCLPSETYERNGVTPMFRSFHRTASSITGD